MALRTEQKLPLILFVVFLTLSTVGFLFYQSQASFQEALAWQRQTNDSLRLADDIERLSMGLDRSVYGFTMTGNDTYLETFNRAKSVIPQDISQLKQRWVDDPEVSAQISALEGATIAVLSEADQQVQIRKIKGPEAAVTQLRNIAYRPLVYAVRIGGRQLK